jgi:hypothetical protein
MNTSVKTGIALLAIGGLVAYSAKAKASGDVTQENSSSKDILGIGMLVGFIGAFMIGSYYLIDAPLSKKYKALGYNGKL